MLFVLAAYAIGQFCSLVFRRAILALFVSAMLLGAVLFWWALLAREARFADLDDDSSHPCSIFLGRAGFSHTKLDRGVKQRSNMEQSLAGPGAVCHAAVLFTAMVYRVESIPQVAIGFSTADITTPSSGPAIETGELYRQAVEAPTPPSEEGWLRDSNDAELTFWDHGIIAGWSKAFPSQKKWV